MKPALKRPAAVILIICAALLIGIVVNAVWTLAEKKSHPDDYQDLIEKYAEKYNIPASVIYATIKVESNFNAKAESSVGARGLMQMMPTTFEWLTGDEHLGEHLSADQLYDPEVSIRYGSYYLTYLYRKFDHNWHNTFAAYNAGEGNVAKWLKESDSTDEKGNLTYIPFSETRSYVSKVESARETYQKLYPAD